MANKHKYKKYKKKDLLLSTSSSDEAIGFDYLTYMAWLAIINNSMNTIEKVKETKKITGISASEIISLVNEKFIELVAIYNSIIDVINDTIANPNKFKIDSFNIDRLEPILYKKIMIEGDFILTEEELDDIGNDILNNYAKQAQPIIEMSKMIRDVSDKITTI